jgi:PKD repeat protein
VDQEVVFDGSGSSDSDGTIESYSWYIDGDYEGSGQTFNWAWDEAGTHTIGLEVVDNGDKTGRTSKTVTISNEGPTPKFSYSPSKPVVDQDVVFDAGKSSDSDGSIESYSWYIDGDYEASGQTFTWAWDEDGTYTVRLEVTDNGDKTNSTSKTVTISNNGPTAKFNYSPSEPVVDQDVVFDAGKSSDSDGSIESYSWYIDGDYEASGQTFTWAWDEAGTHTIELEVIDNGELTNTTSKTVTISNKGPSASFTYSPSNPVVDEDVMFDASGSSDSDGTIESYSWYIDGDYEGSGQTFTWAWDEAGTHTIELEVTDNGELTNTTSKTVTISNEEPSASFTYSPSNPVVDESVVFDASGSSDSDGTIESYSWYIDGDYEASGQTFNWAWDEAGTHTIELEVTDNGDETTSISQAVTISNEEPIAQFSYSPSNPAVDEDILFDASESSDPDGTIESYSWYIDGDYEASGQTFNWMWDERGRYQVTLEVGDNGDKKHSVSKTIAVGNISQTTPDSGGESEGSDDTPRPDPDTPEDTPRPDPDTPEDTPPPPPEADTQTETQGSSTSASTGQGSSSGGAVNPDASDISATRTSTQTTESSTPMPTLETTTTSERTTTIDTPTTPSGGSGGGGDGGVNPFEWLSDALGGEENALIALISTVFVGVSGTLYAIFNRTEAKEESVKQDYRS